MSDAPLEPELADHLRVQFGGYGRRCVEFLATAQTLVEGSLGGARVPESVAYCLREAMKSLIDSQPLPEDPPWNKVSRAVVDARKRYEIAEKLPGMEGDAALAQLLDAVDAMEAFHRAEPKHRRQLQAAMLALTGGELLSGVDELLRLFKQATDALHDSLDADTAVRLHGEVVAVIGRLFAPPQARFARLEALAVRPDPTTEDLAAAQVEMVTHEHIRRFCRRVHPEWLPLMATTEFFDPPTSGAWPATVVSEVLGDDAAPAVLDWLTVMYDRCGHGVEPAWQLARAGLDLGDVGAPLIFRAITDHRPNRSVLALGWSLVDKVDPTSALIEEAADLLMRVNEIDDESLWMLGRVSKTLVDGATRDNVRGRLGLVARRLAADPRDHRGWRLLMWDSGGSVADLRIDDPDDSASVLTAAFVALARVTMAEHGAAAVREAAGALPIDIGGRLLAWVAANDPAASSDELVALVATAIGTRDPSGDDLPIVDRVLLADPLPDLWSWTAALGEPPALTRLGEAIAAHEVPEEWFRSFHWAALLPDHVTAPWVDASAVLASAYGRPRRAGLEKRFDSTLDQEQSPFTAAELTHTGPVQAARAVRSWAPESGRMFVGTRELARTVEAAVLADADVWLADPFPVATELHEPMYICHLLRGASQGVKGGARPGIAGLLKVVDLVHSKPWKPRPLGDRTFDYDPDWAPAISAAIDLLGALASKRLGFDGRTDEAWAYIRAAAEDRSDPGGVTMDDPLTMAINRHCTEALAVAISFLDWERETTGRARDDAFALLDESLLLDGDDGLQHRAVIVARLGYFAARHPDWLDGAASTLFGDAAPDGLAQATVELAIRWSRPNRLLLERFRPAVQAAARADADNALDHVLIANLWGVPGYSVGELLGFLSSAPGLLNRAGQRLGRLARGATDTDALDASVAIWRAALDAGRVGEVAGFAWMAEIEALDDSVWVDLTWRTMQATRGRTPWGHTLPKRAAALDPTVTTLAILDHVVRFESDEWDARMAGPLAVEHLGRAAPLASTDAYLRLQAALMERGYL